VNLSLHARRVLLGWAFLLGILALGRLGTSDKDWHQPYLMLVSFNTDAMTDLRKSKLFIVSHSPYQAVAVPLVGAYDVERHTPGEFATSIKRLKIQHLAVWPWVYWNRVVGTPAGSVQGHWNKPYFRRITGMDIYNKSGALRDFYSLLQISLQSAKRLGSPGIVIDMEPYNNHAVYGMRASPRSLERAPAKCRSSWNRSEAGWPISPTRNIPTPRYGSC